MSQKNISFGKINIIWGEKGSRFPYSNTLFIDDKIKTFIDPSAGLDVLKKIGDERIDRVINSHFHFDHIRFNYVFQNADIWVHKLDSGAMTDYFSYIRKYGGLRILGEQWVNELVNYLNQKEMKSEANSFTYDRSFYRSIGKINFTYQEGDTISFGKENAYVIHTPGHADSMCCFYFPEQSLCYVSDYNVLSDWGPWYGGEESSIQELIKSADRLKEIDADYFVTAHDQAVLTKQEFLKHLGKFISVIDERNRKIESLVKKDISFYELSDLGIFYEKKYHYIHWVRTWETLMLIKHLEYTNLKKIIPYVLKLEEERCLESL